MLVLAQAASQYSPRLLRDYMADRINQLTLAVIVGVFAYCLLVLRSLPADSLLLGPGIAVMVALLGAFVGLALLIYFIHHIASSIQVSQVVAKNHRRHPGSHCPAIRSGVRAGCRKSGGICERRRWWWIPMVMVIAISRAGIR